MPIGNSLVSQSRDTYGESFQTHCLEMYKLQVQMADKISARRQAANSFFLTVNTAVVGLVSYVGNAFGDWNWVVSVSGLVLCIVWVRLVHAYKNLNAIKFNVICDIEKSLPIAPYTVEWEALKQRKGWTGYLPISNIETIVPIVFGGLHLLVLIGYGSWKPS